MNYKPLLYALLIGSTAVSCIRKEAPNAEADITGCTLPGNVLVQDTIDVDVSYDKSLNAYPIYIQVKKEPTAPNWPRYSPLLPEPLSNRKAEAHKISPHPSAIRSPRKTDNGTAPIPSALKKRKYRKSLPSSTLKIPG